MERGEVCLEETVERLRNEGMTPATIAEVMGVRVEWVESLPSPDPDEESQASTSDIE